jgi:hypothetical protein
VGDGSYRSTITLSEPAGNGTVFDRSDLSLTNASATLTGSGTSYRAVLTPASSGKIKLSVAAARFTEAAGNDN